MGLLCQPPQKEAPFTVVGDEVQRSTVGGFRLLGRVARSADSPRRRLDQATVPLVDVIRFTGRSQVELLDLARAGVLEEVPGQGTCQFTASSLRAWMTVSA